MLWPLVESQTTKEPQRAEITQFFFGQALRTTSGAPLIRGRCGFTLVRHALLHEGALLLQVELERLLLAIFCAARGRLASARVGLVPNRIVVGIDIDLRRLGFGASGRRIPATAALDEVIARVAAMNLRERKAARRIVGGNRRRIIGGQRLRLRQCEGETNPDRPPPLDLRPTLHRTRPPATVPLPASKPIQQGGRGGTRERWRGSMWRQSRRL